MCDDPKSNSNEGFTKHCFSLLSFRFYLSFRLKCLQLLSLSMLILSAVMFCALFFIRERSF